MKLYSNTDASFLRHHYEKKFLEMELENKMLQKSDEAAKGLQDETQRIKAQKVQLQNKCKLSLYYIHVKKFFSIRKRPRRNEYDMHKLLVLNQWQKMVLQRKTKEASLAVKRLRELLESRSSRDKRCEITRRNCLEDQNFYLLFLKHC